MAHVVRIHQIIKKAPVYSLFPYDGWSIMSSRHKQPWCWPRPPRIIWFQHQTWTYMYHREFQATLTREASHFSNYCKILMYPNTFDQFPQCHFQFFVGANYKNAQIAFFLQSNTGERGQLYGWIDHLHESLWSNGSESSTFQCSQVSKSIMIYFAWAKILSKEPVRRNPRAGIFYH